MTLEALSERAIERIDATNKKILHDTREDRLWYVEFAPKPKGIKQRVAAWFVARWAPEWALIAQAKSVDIPFSSEEIGEALLSRQEEYHSRMNTPPPKNVMVLQLTE